MMAVILYVHVKMLPKDNTDVSPSKDLILIFGV